MNISGNVDCRQYEFLGTDITKNGSATTTDDGKIYCKFQNTTIAHQGLQSGKRIKRNIIQHSKTPRPQSRWTSGKRFSGQKSYNQRSPTLRSIIIDKTPKTRKGLSSVFCSGLV